jgi:DNA-binding transcriptional regulator YdaS (Cro superfamily)
MSKQQRDPVIRMVREVRGTAPRLAQALGILPGGIWQWQQVPAQHVLAVAELLKIPRYKIRPDLYPPPRRRLNSNGRKQDGARA